MISNNKHKELFNISGCLSEQAIKRYIEKNLSSEENHIVEMHLVDCPLCSDSIEGYQHLKNSSNINKITNEIYSKLSKNNTSKTETKLIISIAAAITLLIITSILLINLNKTEDSKISDINMFKSKPIIPQEQSITSPNIQEIPQKNIPNISNKKHNDPIAPTTTLFETLEKNNEDLDDKNKQEKDEETYGWINTKTIDLSQKAKESPDESKTDITGELGIKEESNNVDKIATGKNSEIGNEKIKMSGDKKGKLKNNTEAKYRGVNIPEREAAEQPQIFDATGGYYPDTCQMKINNALLLKKTKEYQKALNELNILIANNSSCNEEALWQKALLLQEAGMKSEADSLFKMISFSKSKYAKEALEKIK